MVLDVARRQKKDKGWRTFVRRHPVAALGLVLELLLVVWMAAALFAPLCSVEVLPDAASWQLPSSADVEPAEDGLHVSLPPVEDSGAENKVTLRTNTFALQPGAYLVTIAYQPDSTTRSTTAGEVTLQQTGLSDLLYAQELTLDGGHTCVTGRAWVPFGAKADGVYLEVSPTGQCDFVLQGVTFQEQPVYRWMRLLGTLLLLAAVDGAVWQIAAGGCSLRPGTRRKQKILLALAGISLIAALPFFYDTLRNGDDLEFHLYRLSCLAQELRQGQWPVRLFTGGLNGYGYPTPLYYCDLFLYLPALLYNCMLPLQFCYQIYGVLTTVCTAVACYASLRWLRCTEKISLVCTALYLLSAYRLSNVFLRSAVGEYTAMIFLPLVVSGIALLYRASRPTWKDGLPLTVGMAGLAMCHLLSLEMACLFLALFALVAARKTFRKARLWALVRAALLAIGLSAWFLVPMLQAMATQPILATSRYTWDFQERGTQLMDLLAPLPLNLESINEVRGELGLGILLALLVCLAVLWQRRVWKLPQDERMRLLQYTLGLGAVATLFSLRAFPWNTLFSHCKETVLHRLLGMIQFPWRYLGLASVLFCVAAAAALQLLQTHDRTWARRVAAGLLAGSLVYGCAFYVSLEIMRPRTLTVYGDSYEGTMELGAGKEYILPGEVDYSYARPTQMPDTLLVKWYEKTGGVAHITLENTADTEASVTLPLNDYGNYRAVDTEGTSFPLSTSENSLLVLTVPGGYSGAISVSYREPILWRVSELISLLTALGMLAAWWRQRRSQKLAGQCAGK